MHQKLGEHLGISCKFRFLLAASLDLHQVTFDSVLLGCFAGPVKETIAKTSTMPIAEGQEESMGSALDVDFQITYPGE